MMILKARGYANHYQLGSPCWHQQRKVDCSFGDLGGSFAADAPHIRVLFQRAGLLAHRVTKNAWTRDEAGNRSRITRDKLIRPWHFPDGQAVSLTIRYGGRVLDLGKGRSASVKNAVGGGTATSKALRMAPSCRASSTPMACAAGGGIGRS